MRPQPGPQELVLSCPADIAIIGGSLFGGKTWSLIYEALRHVAVKGFNFAIFRRVMPEVRNPGGMWDESLKWYPLVGGEPREQDASWYFPSTAWGKFAGLQYEKDKLGWKGAQLCYIGFDQLEEFTESQFWYLVGRNRSTCGVRPYVRASCNPDPDSFLAPLLAWWIDQSPIEAGGGYAIPERSGVIRWYLRVNDVVQWSTVECGIADYARYAEFEQLAKGEMAERYGPNGRHAKSLSFILARLQDNAIGNALSPEYIGSVLSMTLVEQERLYGGDKGGNWKIRPAAGLVFNRAWFTVVDAAPVTVRARVRAWDKAGTTGGGDTTSGTKISLTAEGLIYIEDNISGQWAAGEREKVIQQTAVLDGKPVSIWIEQEPGSGGKDSAHATVTGLPEFNARAETATGDKVHRANPLAAQAQAGNVKLVRGPWNETYLRNLHGFPTKGLPDDDVDSSSLAYKKLLEQVNGVLEYYRLQVEAMRAEKAKKATTNGAASNGHSAV